MNELIAYAFAGVVLFLYFVDRLMGRLTPKSRFPVCYTCGKTCQQRTSPSGIAMPDKIRNYLKQYELPDSIVSRYVCPKGHVIIWYAPRAGKAEKGTIATQRL